MNCEETRALLDGYADGELDLVNHLQIEQHIRQCPECELALENRTMLKSTLADDSMYFRAPSDLRAKIRNSIRETKSEQRAEKWWRRSWTPILAATAALAAILLASLFLLRPAASNDDLLAREFVSSHVRSMMVDHLTDVPSTDQHTVKPWFEGKLDFSPPVVDLGPQGFELKGGRLDYVNGRPTAALVYQRRQHVINLFVLPSNGKPDSPNEASTIQGFNLIRWERSGMGFWAVSDLNMDELREFAGDLQR